MSRVTLPAVNAEFAKRGIEAFLAKDAGYFLLRGPAVTEWLNRSVAVEHIGDLSLEQWVDAYRKLERENRQLLQPLKKRRKR